MDDDAQPRQIRWALVGAPLAVIAAAALIGNALAPTLVVSHPLILLALNTTTRHLILTSTSVDVVPYVVIGLARRLAEDPFLFLLGRWYGEDAIAWVDAKVGGGRFLGFVQRNFHRVGWLLVAVAPGGVVCVLAGASRMRTWVFLVLNVAGTIATIAALRRFGDTYAAPVEATVEFLGENVVVLTALSILVTVAYLARRRRHGRSGGVAGPPDPE